GGAAAAIVWRIIQARRRARAAPALVGASAPPHAIDSVAPPARPPMPAELAARGEFELAVHALFLAELSRLASWLKTEFASGRTGRELVALAPEGAPRSALAELGALVERNRFAGASLTGADWTRAESLASCVDAACATGSRGS